MIRFDHISKKYPGTSRPALNDVDFEILRGEFIFLVGASGSGKSSCLRLMLKEDKPSKGKIHVLGHDLGSISNRKVPYFRRSLGVVFQDFRLLPGKTVYQNVAFTLQVIGKSRGFVQEAVPDVLKMVGLEGKAQRLPHELSGGEQQRVAIARAIVNKPQILLADEPTGNLDPGTSAGIMQLLERINAGGTTVVMATHEAGFVDQMQRRVIELQDGRIVRDERHGGYGTTAAIPGLIRGSSGAAPVESAATAAAAAVAAGIDSVATPTTGGVPVDGRPATSQVPVVPRTETTAVPVAPAYTAPVAEPIAQAGPAAPAPVAPVESSPAPAAPPVQPAAAQPVADAPNVQFSQPAQPQQPAQPVQPAAQAPTAPAPALNIFGAPIVEPTVPAPQAPVEVPAPQVASTPEPADAPVAPPGPPEPTPPQRLTNATGPIGLPARNEIDPAEAENLSLAERLGLRAAGRTHDDGEQNVGPTK
ncbi:cell division ATP-binding protein FtsE [Plantibacter sp. Mn2098]|uniref:cell division ATP-binding protein FtsE n=2 Tax=unclassified Plantibacter TaxID=2624265 RepID=UPI003BED52E9